jgi:hypothetical protein
MTKSLALRVEDLKQLAEELEINGAEYWESGYSVADDPFLTLTTVSEFQYE